MYEIVKAIASMDVPFNMIVFVVMVTCAASVLKVIAKQVRDFGCHRQDIEFKRELVERGMSVDEIERIIAAGGTTGSPTSVHVGNYVAGKC